MICVFYNNSLYKQQIAGCIFPVNMFQYTNKITLPSAVYKEPLGKLEKPGPLLLTLLN